MLIGLVVWKRSTPHKAIRCVLVEILCPGVPRSNPLSHGLAANLSIERWQTQLHKLFG